ncbi:hypothetical protein [Parapedobacter sp. 10938]|uniref:hypothetical protein n=1 Tax=Parapedobacter flavus TaxID=3110225 RepID=UPI002DB6100E|nr:hypothetical protein [Parapedobacter sp. 10938]MEC3878776.1 hypothetical protein [Parapedobacter sp. 10938]
MNKLMIALFFLLTLTLEDQAQEKRLDAQNKEADISVHEEIARLLWTNLDRRFYDISDETPQHFIFSIRFDIDSKGSITAVENSVSMREAFDGIADSLYEEIDKELFVRTKYRNTRVVVPIMIFIVQGSTPIDYNATLAGLENMWSYDCTNNDIKPTIFFPPIYRATAKFMVDFTVRKEDLNSYEANRLTKDLPENKSKN